MASIDQMLAAFVGYGSETYPKESEERLTKFLKAESNNGDLAKLNEILSFLNNVEIDWSEHDLKSATKYASSITLKRFPELSEDSQLALEWCFSWWNRK